MIQVTSLAGDQYYVNDDLIRTMEGTPDTHLTLTDGSKLIVRESCEEVLRRIIAFRQEILRPAARRARHTAERKGNGHPARSR